MLPLTRRSSVICARPVMFWVCLYSRMLGLLSRGGCCMSQLQHRHTGTEGFSRKTGWLH